VVRTKKRTTPSTKPFVFALSFTSIVAAITIVLMLLGFGVAASYQSDFGLELSVISDSSFDYLVLAHHAVAFAVIEMGSRFEDLAFSAYTQILLPFFLGLILLTVLLLRVARKVDKCHCLKRRVKRLLMGIEELLGRCWSKRRSEPVLAYAKPASVMTLLLMTPFAIYAVLWLPFLLLAFLPAVGFGLGKQSNYETIINAAGCTPVHSKPNSAEKQSERTRNRGYTVNCAKVVDMSASSVEEKVVASGRIVFWDSKRITLYLPINRKVLSIPTGDKLIERVENL
jgi:hypothetical protein